MEKFLYVATPERESGGKTLQTQMLLTTQRKIFRSNPTHQKALTRRALLSLPTMLDLEVVQIRHFSAGLVGQSFFLFSTSGNFVPNLFVDAFVHFATLFIGVNDL